MAAELKEERLIRRLASVYPHRSSALLPMLHRELRLRRRVSRRSVRSAARILGISPARAWGSATYYSMFPDTRTGKYHIMVDTNVAAMLAGSDSVVAALEGNLGIRLGETTPDGLFSLFSAEDLGAGGVAPALLVNDTLYGHMSAVSAGDLVLALRGGRLPLADNEVRAVPTSSLLLRPLLPVRPEKKDPCDTGALKPPGAENPMTSSPLSKSPA